MRLIFYFTFFTALIYGCRSSQSAEKSAVQTPDTARTTGASVGSKPTAIVQNITRVEAVVEKVTVIDNIQFTLGIFVVRSEPVQGRYSIVEPQQRVTLHPEFHVSGTDGSVDLQNAQNKKMLSLREVQVGHSFTGKISIDQRGIWRLLEVEVQ